MSKSHNCVLCGITFIGHGNNPEPLAEYDEGRCCDECNMTRVIPARIARIIPKGDDE